MIFVPYIDSEYYEPLSGYDYGLIPDQSLRGSFFIILHDHLNKGKIKVDISCCFNFKHKLNIFID